MKDNSQNNLIPEARHRLAAETETAGAEAFEYGRAVGYAWAARDAHPLDLAFMLELDPSEGEALLNIMRSESSNLEFVVEGFDEDDEWVRQARLFSGQLVGGFVTGACELHEAVGGE